MYVSGNALVILDRPDHILQTIYHDDQIPLDSVDLDEATGKIAVCSTLALHIYRPFGQEEGVLKVRIDAPRHCRDN